MIHCQSPECRSLSKGGTDYCGKHLRGSHAPSPAGYCQHPGCEYRPLVAGDDYCAQHRHFRRVPKPKARTCIAPGCEEKALPHRYTCQPHEEDTSWAKPGPGNDSVGPMWPWVLALFVFLSQVLGWFTEYIPRMWFQ